MKYKKMLQEIDLAVTRISGISSIWSASKGHSAHEISIMFVLMSGDIVTQKDICDMTAMPKQSAFNIIKDWSNKGYIKMLSHPKDKRAKSIHLTNKGEQYIDETLAEIFEMRASIIDEMGEEKFLQFTKTLNQYYRMLADILQNDMK